MLLNLSIKSKASSIDSNTFIPSSFSFLSNNWTAYGFETSNARNLAPLDDTKTTRNHLQKYVYRRQILKNLAEKYRRSISWIRKQILDYETPKKFI